MAKLRTLKLIKAKVDPDVEGGSGVDVPIGTDIILDETVTCSYYKNEKFYCKEHEYKRLESSNAAGNVSDKEIADVKMDEEIKLKVKMKEAEARLKKAGAKTKKGKKK